MKHLEYIFWEGTKFPSYSFALLFSQLLAIYDIEVPCHPVRENSVTQPEQLLAEEGQLDLAEQVRADLNQAMQPQIKSMVEAVLAVDVLDLLSDATLETKRTGMIVILSDTPSVRNPEAIPKVKLEGKGNGKSKE
ncbi:MAG: hypothetical protein DCF15_17835 [Phormidesmis priestleyi]|uniref:Na+-translocating membrane potential-generating system MpsC domain-containing protein n=1 Tax=Phormidesmis priestleyi TaxID=268141 RepID=A0A2W4WVG3_9CYAN|nr:MAG: hypothetical protein DCF15_17835 [Phormidesmis priestleyi]